MRRQKSQGQSALEYSMLLIVLMGAFMAIQLYMKRGVQGRWKDSIDEMGDQYDPRTAVTNVRHTLVSDTATQIVATNTEGGYWTSRSDMTNSTESKTGGTRMGAY